MAEDALGIDETRIYSDASNPPPGGWPAELEEQFQKFRAIDPKRIVNAENMGDLAFNGADRTFENIVRVLGELRLEPWQYVAPAVGGQAIQSSNGLYNTLRQMAELRSSRDNARQAQTSLLNSLNDLARFFMQEVRPLCIKARVIETLTERHVITADDPQAEELAKLRHVLEQYERDAAEFRELSDLVAAQRQLVGREGASDLSAHFTSLAKDSGERFSIWGRLVAVVSVLGLGVAVLFAWRTHPGSHASNASVVSYTLMNALVIGIIVFLIRFVAIQARAYRHVEFVSRNKANALSTFNLLVAGQEDPEVRTQVASALAQAVFKSDDGIFSDSSGDSVTIVERVVGAVSNRQS